MTVIMYYHYIVYNRIISYKSTHCTCASDESTSYIMNQEDKNCNDVYGVYESDKQTCTELNQPQPGDSNKHIYYELH